MNDIEKALRGEEDMKKNKLPQIVRCYGAGVFYAIVESRKGQEAVLSNSRRLWYWSGAASLSQLAMEGTKLPVSCKFPCAVDRIEVMEVHVGPPSPDLHTVIAEPVQVADRKGEGLVEVHGGTLG